MISRQRTRSKGQALVEFALILIVLLMFIFVIIEAGRMFQGWLTVQNSARAAGRYALTGNYDIECLYEFPECLDPRVYYIKEEARRTAAGLSVDENALVGTPRSFITEVWSQDEDGVWKPDFAGGAGDLVRIKVTYNMPIVVPFFRVIAKSIGLIGQVTITTEAFDQVTTSRTYTTPPVIGQINEPEGPPEADVSISKSVHGDPSPTWVYAGKELSWDIAVQNQGSFDVEDVVVVDTLPEGSTYLGSVVSGSGYCDAPVVNELTCYLPNLAGDGGPDSFAYLTINTLAPTVAPTNPTIATNVASVNNGPATIDPNPGNNNTSVTINLTPWADLTVSKGDSPDPVRISRPLTYTVGVQNLELNEAHNVIVVDDLPDEVSFIRSAPAGMCSYDSGNHRVNCGLPLLVPGDSFAFTIVVMAPPSVDFIENNASVSADEDDLDPGNNDTSEITTVEPALTDLAIIKLGTPYDPYAGESFTYNIEVYNNGPDNAPSTRIEDRIPAGLVVLSYSPSQGSCTQIGTNVVCDLGPIPNNDSAQVTIEVSSTLGIIVNNDDTPVTNRAEVFWGSDQIDPDVSNNFANAVNLIREWVDLSIIKTATEEVFDGDLITYTLAVYNDGPFLAQNVEIFDSFPWPEGDTDGEYGSPECIEINASYARCLIGDLAIGASQQVTVVARADSVGSSWNLAKVYADEDDPFITDNNQDEALTIILPKTGLEVLKYAPNTVYIGVPFDYWIRLENNGPSDATGVVMTDTLPISVSYLTVSPSNICGYDPVMHVVICRRDLQVGAVQWIRVSVTPDDEGVIVNMVATRGDDYDPYLVDNSDIVTNTVLAAADMAINKTGPDYVDFNDIIEYTIVITNNGPSIATNITVEDIYPLDLNTIALPPTCSNASNIITCDVGTLAVGATDQVRIRGKSLDTGFYVNIASVRATEFDPDMGNNSSSARTFVDADVDLAIDKDGPGFSYTGELLPYTLNVTNLSIHSAHDVRITDTLPLTVTFDTADANCIYSPRPIHTVICAVGDIASGATNTTVINVIPEEKGVVLNTAIVDGLETDTNRSNNIDTLLTAIDPAANLDMDKTAPDFVTIGDTLPYTLTIFNGGPYTATNVVVTDTLPVSVTFNSASPGCGPGAGNTVLCSVAEIAPDDNAILNIWVTPFEYGPVVNIATTRADEWDPNTANNTDSVKTQITQADLQLIKTATSPVYLGEDLVYTLQIQNSGPSAATSVVVTDTLPKGVSYDSDDAGCANNALDHILTCSLASIPTQGSATIHIIVVPTQTGMIENTATVLAYDYDPNLVDNTDSVTSTVLTAADLALTKTGPISVTVGDQFEYELVVSNSGPSDATGVTVIDALPDQVVYLGNSYGCTFDSPNLTCDVGDMTAGAVLTITVQVEAAVFGTAINTAVVSGIEFDLEPENNSASTSTSITQSDLSVEKSGRSLVTVLEEFDYTLSVNNNGPGDATGVVVTDTLPPGFVLVSANMSCGEISGNRIVCDLGQLTAFDSVVIVLTVNATQPGPYVNEAKVYGDEQDPDLGNNLDTAATDVTAADLRISKSASDQVYMGEDLIYTLTIFNDGPSTATMVTVVDTLPSGVTYLSDSTGCSYDGPTHAVTCNRPPIPSQGSDTIEITVAPAEVGLFTNSATANAHDYDPDLSNNTDTASTNIIAAADLQIVKTGPLTITVDDPVIYSLQITNDGPSNATGVVVTDTLPSGVDYVSDDQDCSYDGNTHVLTCDIGNMAQGASQVIIINCTALQPGENENTAVVGGADYDPDLSNNNDSTNTVVTQADLTLVKTAPLTSTIGATLVYTLSVTNFGPSEATNVTVVDTLPEEVTYESSSAGCTFDGSTTVDCNIASLPLSTTGIFNITVIPNSAGVIVNSAAVSSDQQDPNLTDNSSSAATTITEADVRASKSGPPIVTIGETFSYEVKVVNKGPSPATGVVLTDTLPPSVTFVSASPECQLFSGNLWVCDIGPLAVDQEIIFSLTVIPNQQGDITNYVEAWGKEYDPVPNNNTTNITTLVTAADIEIVKSADGPIYHNEPFDYTLTVTNNGPNGATNVVVTDTLPAGVTYLTDDSSCAYGATTHTLTCDLGTISFPGTTTIVVTVEPNQLGSIVNTAVVDAYDYDPVDTNNTDVFTTTVLASADLAITKSATPQVTVGGSLFYTVSVTNNGPSDASGIVVTDTMHWSVNYIFDSGGCIHDDLNDQLVCTLGAITATNTVSFTVLVYPTQTGDISNTVDVTGNEFDPDADNNSDTASTGVNSAAWPLDGFSIAGVYDGLRQNMVAIALRKLGSIIT